MSHLFLDDSHKTARSFELVGAYPHYTPDRPGQVEHIFLDLVLDLAQQTCTGICQIRLRPIRNDIRTLTLDAVGFVIHEVTVAQATLPFTTDGQHLQIELIQPTQADQVLTIEIAYTLDHPRRGLYFIQPDADYPDKPTQVWTQGEDEDSRFWFPCFDYPGQLATSEIRVKVPQTYLAISNGALIATALDEDQMIYHWRQDQVHPTYLMTLAVGEFVELRDEWRGKPVLYYVLKGQEECARLSMGKTPHMMEFFSDKFGMPYPYPKYAQVCVADFIFGGMENTSTTLLGDRYLVDERAALDTFRMESLVAHELAHQWFGDLVVIKHWSHAWLKEGMASYAEVLWTEQEYGTDDAAYYRLQEARSYIREDQGRYRRPVVTHVYRAAIELYDCHLYEKGACIYHMLRAELGEALFWRSIHAFVQEHAHKTVETVDLLRAIDRTTGRNLTFLLDQYVYRGGHPHYKVNYSWDSDSSMAKVTVTQIQAEAAKANRHNLFDLKIPIAFGWTTETQQVGESSVLEQRRFRVRVHEYEQSFYFGLASQPDFVSFDEGNHILKQVTLEYPLPALRAQLAHDPDPLSRLEAAAALAKQGSLEAVQALGTALKTDPFWGVRAEVAQQLGTVKLDQVLGVLKAGLKDPESRVRRAVVDAIANQKHRNSYKLLKSIVEKGDPSYYVEAAAIQGVGTLAGTGLLAQPKEEAALKLFKAVLKQPPGWNEVIRAAAIAGLSAMKQSPTALDLILKYTAQGTPQPLRLAAIRALGPCSLGQAPANIDRILERLSAIASESFFLTQVAAIAALKKMETLKAIDILKRLAQQTSDHRVCRIAEEAIQTVQAASGSEPAMQAMQQEIAELQQTNQALNSRLAALEAQQPASA